MYIFDDDDFELSSDLDASNFLNDLPFDLIKETISNQISDPLSTNTNYLSIITDKCEILRNQYEDNQDSLNNIDYALKDFFLFIIHEIDNKMNLGVAFDEDTAIPKVNQWGESLYNFFVLRYKKNIGRFIYKFIVKNKKLLTEEYSDISKKKDVTSISLKKAIKNKDDLNILTNLPSIIKTVLTMDIEPQEFMKYACNPDHYEGIVIRDLITLGIISNNFVHDYMSMMFDTNDDIMDEITTEIRMRIINKK